jgi:serine/threonine-protein kinase HipA
MGRKRTSRALDVYVGKSRVGTYSHSASGATAFRYTPEWLASPGSFPISLSLPLSDRQWTGDAVSTVFDGLLPDDRTVREKIAARERADSAGTFDLLAAIGRDCVGALRFIPEGADAGNPAKMLSRPVTDDEIARRLATLGTNPLGMQPDDDWRISIAGVQEKTAYLRKGNRWHIPEGATPTSHIFKPAMREGAYGADFSDSPWNEWLCLTICAALGLPAAKSEVLVFDKKPVIIVERFDRVWDGGILYRLPQEDLCQALGVPATRKYESDGGPGILDVLEFLNQAAAPHTDRLLFFRAQVAFWLLAAIDGHAKNFSVFLTPDGFSLTPLYDIMSAAPYPQFSPQKVKLAMAIGDHRHYRLREIAPRHFHQTGRKAGLHETDIDELFEDISASLHKVLETAGRAAKAARMPSKTAETILDGVKKRAAMIQ